MVPHWEYCETKLKYSGNYIFENVLESFWNHWISLVPTSFLGLLYWRPYRKKEKKSWKRSCFNTLIYQHLTLIICNILLVVTNTTDITKSSKHVINLDFQEHCVRCSGLASRYNSGMMKKLADYQRSKYSRKSHLSFTTRHMGRCVQVVVTMPCPLCQTAEEKWALFLLYNMYIIVVYIILVR